MSEVSASADPVTEDIALASSMIEVHGRQAAAVARNNARTAALAGQRQQAKAWLRVVGLIQQRADGGTPRPSATDPQHRPWAVPGVGGSF